MERYLVVAFCDRGDLSVYNKEIDLDQSFGKYTVISLNHPLLNSRRYSLFAYCSFPKSLLVIRTFRLEDFNLAD